MGGLEIGRIYMGNNAGLVLEFTTVLLRRYDPVHGVIYVVCVHSTLRLRVVYSEVPKNVV